MIVLLGPQRLQPTLAQAIDALEIGGPMAAVTAGWQEGEEEDDELRDHLGGRIFNLRLYRRADEVFGRAPELAAAHRDCQDRLRELQELYRLRLRHAMAAARQLLGRRGGSPMVEREQEAAIAAVRGLDEDHLEQVRRVRQEFEERRRPEEQPVLAEERRRLAAKLEPCKVLAIAGGHVAVLLNRLRLFGVAELWGQRGPVVAWSAGAMALAERVVLFHDNPPQGAGDAEVLEAGLGLYQGLLPFPHARRRLRLGDARRVALLSRRFAPARCIALDEGAQLYWNGAYWSSPDSMRRLSVEGKIVSESGGP